MQDIRYAVRSLARQPVFAFVVIVTLALGIGANTAVFSLIYQTLLRPLPYEHADRLVVAWNSYPRMGLPKASVSIPDYLDRRAHASAIEEAALFHGVSLNLAAEGRPERLDGLAVTPSFFATLGRTPAIGRPFSARDAMPGHDRYVVLTHALWASRFGADPSIVGRDIRLNGEAYEVVGVMPATFEPPSRDVALFVPFSFTPDQMSDQERGREFSVMIARLRPGATIALLDAQMRTIVERNVERIPNARAFVARSGFTGYAVPLRDEIAGDLRLPLLVLQAGVALVLLIACANIANLLLMRATGRYREMAIRKALGAGQTRLVRQLVAEGLVLAAAGGAVGIAAGFAGLHAAATLAEDALPVGTRVALDPAVLAFTSGLALLTGVVFGLVPAHAVAHDRTGQLLRDDSGRASADRTTGRTRAALVVAETALALILLVAAGLLIKSFARLQQVDAGFDGQGVLTAQIALPEARYPDPDARRAFWTRLVGRVREIPGVTAAGLTSNIPLSGNVSSGSYSIVGYTPGPTEAAPHGRQQVVGGDYFRALQIPLVKGRWFTDADTDDSRRVVVIDQFLADRYFEGRDPIGQQILRNGPDPITIVGVVGTVNAIDLAEPVSKERLYYPVTQQPHATMGLTIRTRPDPMTLVPQVRAAVSAIDPEQPLSDVRTMDQWVARSLQGRRMPMLLLGVFGAVALLLSAIGTYGVLAFGVAQRVREFGIRQALGADRSSIFALVLRQGLATIGLGVVIGLAGALALSRVLGSLLFTVQPRDPAVFAAVAVLLAGVALLACVVPARRATRIDPIEALRDA